MIYKIKKSSETIPYRLNKCFIKYEPWIANFSSKNKWSRKWSQHSFFFIPNYYVLKSMLKLSRFHLVIAQSSFPNPYIRYKLLPVIFLIIIHSPEIHHTKTNRLQMISYFKWANFYVLVKETYLIKVKHRRMFFFSI